MHCTQKGCNTEKIAIVGTGYLSERTMKVESLPYIINNKTLPNLQKKLAELLPQDFNRKYTGTSDYVKYGYLAAREACLRKAAEHPEQWGVFCGTGLGGSSEIYIRQCITYYERGLSWILPSSVMNKVAKATADILAIEHHIKGRSYTILAGRVSSGMALMQAYDDIINHEITHSLVVGAEYIDEYLFKAFSRIGYPTQNLCSGGCSLTLCNCENTEADSIEAYLRACDCSAIYMDPTNPDPEALSEIVVNAIQSSLERAKLSISDIDGVIFAKTYNDKVDQSIESSIRSLFGKCENKLFCMTDYLGDMLGANLLLAVLTSLSIIKYHGSLKEPTQFCKNNLILGLVYGLNGQVCTVIIENANRYI